MKKSVLITILIILLLAITIATLSACEKADKSSIQLVIVGDAYKGAVLDIYANVSGIDDTSDVKFSIVEDYDWVVIQDGKLLFTKNAVVGSTVTVKVVLRDYSDQVQLVVGNTPIKSISINPIPNLKAGESVELSCQFDPIYADDVAVQYVVTEGDQAHIENNVLHVDSFADYRNIVKIKAVAGGIESAEYYVKISTVQPETLEINSSISELKRGDVAIITCLVTPNNCTLGKADLQVPPSDFYRYENGVLTVLDNAPEGDIQINAKLGKLEQSLTLKIVKTAVEGLDLTSSSTGLVKYGENVNLAASVYPKNATYPDVTINVIEGADCIKLSGSSFEVVTKEVGCNIKIEATADGVTSVILFKTVEILVEDFDLDVGNVSVKEGDKRTITATFYPQNATRQELSTTIIEGDECAILNGNEILFVKLEGEKSKVVVQVKSGNITKEVTFYVVPIPVESITISTNSETSGLRAGDSVVFDSIVAPTNASYKEVEYIIESGNECGSFQANVLTIYDAVFKGRVIVYAQSKDGIKSNKITLDVLGDIDIISPTSWAKMDNDVDYLEGKISVRIDFTSLPQNADYTTLIISDDVEYLELFGNFDGHNNVIENLYLYFLTTDYIQIKLENFAVVATGGFNDYVIDFGNYAEVKLEVVGENLIKASSSYMLNPSGYMRYGENDSMNGYGGVSGGTAINANNLEILGSGNLKLIAGDGSNGTFATNGIAGFGGDSGYCIFSSLFTCNVKGKLTLIGGNAGVGGKNREGTAGSDGVDGVVRYPIFASSSFLCMTNNYEIIEGQVESNSRVREVNYNDYAKLLAKYYKINVYYGKNLKNYHSLQYKMTELHDEYRITRMLYALEFALSTLPKNLYLEIMQKTKKPITIYFADTITHGGKTVYGLTSSINNVYFADFDTKLRGIFDSNPYNIMLHEILHVLTYGLSSAAQKSAEIGLPKFNLNYPYVQNEIGVYNPQGGKYDANNSVFLCIYSKSNYMEDISDTLSLIAVMVAKPDFLESGKPLKDKVEYISNIFINYYDNLTSYTDLIWKKFV